MNSPIRLSYGITLTDPILLGTLLAIIVIFVVYNLVHHLKNQEPPESSCFGQLVDEAVESGETIALLLSHKGLGTSSIVETDPAFTLLSYSWQRMQSTGRAPQVLSADGIIVATALGVQQKDAPSHLAMPEVIYTGPEPFLSAANTAYFAQQDGCSIYSYGQASSESILLEQSWLGLIQGGAPTPLAGLLLSNRPEEAILGERYYTLPIMPELINESRRALHRYLAWIILFAVIAGLVLGVLGIIAHA